jgi:MFS family permease
MLVGSIWVTLAIASGLYFSFPIFFVALFEEFGWSRGATALAFSISSITQGLLSPVVGTLVDRFGPRRVILSGTFVLGAACLLGSRVGSLWSLYLITGVLAAVGVCAVSWVPSGALIARWFAERRGSMMGIAFSGMGAGVLLMGPLAQWLIDGYGWRAAYLVLGMGTLAVLVPIVWFGIRDAPAASAPRRGDACRPRRRRAMPRGRSERPSGRGPSGRFSSRISARRSPSFPSSPTRWRSRWTRGSPASSWPASSGSPGSCRSWAASVSASRRIASGARRRPRSRTAARRRGRSACSGSSRGVTRRRSMPMPLLFGLGFGARGPIITAIASQLFHGRRFGVIYGFLSVGNGIGGGIAPWFGGAIHDVTGSYRIAFLIAVGFCAMGAACFWLARPPHRR